jgi:dTDP-glucose 4,6-dehydratase
MRVLVTGGCGFIGHHFVEHVLSKTDWEIVVIDKLTYASMGFDRLKDSGVIYNPRVNVLTADFTIPFSEGIRREIGEIDVIVHMGAESHVDNSIKDPRLFFHSNIDGTVEILEYARSLKNLKMFFYFSTDEVFGPAPGSTSYKEWDRHKPANPYSASKAAAEDICLAYENTYKVPLIIVNVMNVFGERQHVEKFIPMTIKKILNKEKVLIHSDKGMVKAGSRFYIHARNVSDAVLFLLREGKLGEKYNIAGEREIDNLEMANLIATYMGMHFEYEMIDFHSSRPGHDLRYCLDGSKLINLGWKHPILFEDSLKNTVMWTLRNKKFLEAI